VSGFGEDFGVRVPPRGIRREDSIRRASEEGFGRRAPKKGSGRRATEEGLQRRATEEGLQITPHLSGGYR